MTGLPNRRAFEEYMERIRTGEVGCRDAVLTYIRLEGLNERNDCFGLQAGDEAVIAARDALQTFAARARTEAKAYRASAPAETSSPLSAPSQVQIRGSCTGSSARSLRGTTAPVCRAPASR